MKMTCYLANIRVAKSAVRNCMFKLVFLLLVVGYAAFPTESLYLYTGYVSSLLNSYLLDFKMYIIAEHRLMKFQHGSVPRFRTSPKSDASLFGPCYTQPTCFLRFGSVVFVLSCLLTNREKQKQPSYRR